MNFKDRIIRATGQKTPFRLIVVDLTATMNEIGRHHNAKGFALKLLAENSIASIFLSAGLKFAGTVSYTTTYGGEITKIQTDSTPMGLVRAMIPQDDLTRLHTEKCPCGRTMRVMDRISARSDDMLIIHGVNVFPGQIEAGLLRVPEVAPHYQIILSSTDTLDLFEIKVEVNADAFSDSVRKMEELRKRVFDAVKSIIGDRKSVV